MVELCRSRVDILKFDEEYLMREVANINFQKLRVLIKQVSFHVLYIALATSLLNIPQFHIPDFLDPDRIE